VELLCLFCCNIYFSVHQYQLSLLAYRLGLSSVPVTSRCSKSESRKIKLFCD